MPTAIKRIRRHLRDMIDYWRSFRRNEHTRFRVVKVSTAQELMIARQLHADVYLTRKFVTQKDIVHGVLGQRIDPYHSHSLYFIAVDKGTGDVVATARQIMVRSHKAHDSFAMVRHIPLYKRAAKLIKKHDPRKCVEISGLAKHRGVSKLAPLLLYRAMWQNSLEQGHELWLIASDVHLFMRLKLLFGPAIQKAGPVTFYLGSNVVPSTLRVNHSIQAARKAIDSAPWYQQWLRKRVIRFMLNGINKELLTLRERKELAIINKRYKIFVKSQ